MNKSGWPWRGWLAQGRAWLQGPGEAGTRDEYPTWIAERIQARSREYVAPHLPQLFSIITPVFDPPVEYLRALAESVFAQDYPDFEWIVVNNGCRGPEVLKLLELMAADPRVILIDSDTNLGIVGGLALAASRACHRYLVPVDHDDRLYPDALRVLAAFLEHHLFPKVVYTDEDKWLPDERPGYPFCKPDWDPILFLNCCYTAHLGVLDRHAARAAGVYSDPAAEGAADWDAFSRMVAAGHTPVHCPEILYSWRMHPGSTAAPTESAKPWTIASQYHVIQSHLACFGLQDKLTARANPLFGDAGMWRIARLPSAETAPLPVLVTSSPRPRQRALVRRRLAESRAPILKPRGIGSHPATWATALQDLRGEQLVVLLDGNVLPLTTDWVNEALALFEASPLVVLAGGLILDRRGRVAAAGKVFGMDGVCGEPFAGLEPGGLAGFGMLIHQHWVSAVDHRFCVARVGFLRDALAERQGQVSPALLPAWLGAAARQRGLRVAFSPHWLAQELATPVPCRYSADEAFQFLESYWPFVGDEPHYSRFLGLTRETAYRLVSPADRAAALNRTLSQLAGALPFHEGVRVDPAHFSQRTTPRRRRSDPGAPPREPTLSTLHAIDSPRRGRRSWTTLPEFSRFDISPGDEHPPT